MPVNVSIVKNGNHQYIRVCQSYRNEKGQPTSRVIENHGRLDLALLKDPQYVEKLRERVKQQNELEKKTKIELIAKQAIQKVCEYGSMGYRWLIDMDLAKFFDTVNHEKLLSILSKEVKDKRVLSLVHKFLRVPVAENGQTYQTTTGTPQGGCCSPVLANILLNELDHEIKRRGLRAVRYADDMVIFCKTKRSAERVLRNMIPYIEGKLLLKVNKQKTKVVEISDQDGKFLGFSFRNWKRDKEGRITIRAVPYSKSIKRLKRNVKVILKRNRGWSAKQYQEKLNPIVGGWANYFKVGLAKKMQEGFEG